MAPGFALALLLLSPVMHWGVLINTNAWYGCEEGILTLTMEVFAPRKLCYAYTYASRGSGAFVHTHQKSFISPQGVQQPPLVKVSLKRSQKVDLGRCRSQGPIRSLGLEAKGLRRARFGV